MTQIVQLVCVHCTTMIDVADPFRKLNTVPLICPGCGKRNELMYEDSDEGLFYFEKASPVTLDPVLLAKVTDSVRIGVRLPMRIRVSKLVKGKVQDSHDFEVAIGADIPTLQKELVSIARRWKGGFEVGTVFTVERIT